MIVTDLTDLATVKGYISSTTLPTTDDALLTRLITMASTVIIRFTGRDIAEQSYNEIRNGNGKDRMVTKQFPIISVSSVIINTTSIPLAPNSVSFGYAYDEEMVYLNGYGMAGLPFPTTQLGQVFEKGVQNVQVSYVAGFATIPADIVQVCCDLVALWYTDRKRLGQTGVTVGDEHLSYMSNTVATARTLLPLKQFQRKFTPYP